ncbi:hypothetical protein ACWF94_11870 [Streptomyces sp. NPDC055078]
MKPELLTPLLSGGEKIAVSERTPAQGIWQCEVTVDGKVVLKASQEWWHRGSSLAMVARLNAYVKDGTESEGGKTYASKTGAVGRVACAQPKKPDSVLYAIVGVTSHLKPGESATRDFITNYADAVGSSSPQCTA